MFEVERREDLLLLQPLIDAELIADVTAFDDQKLLVEFFLQVALPLKRQVQGTDDKNPLGEASKLQRADQKSGHDRFAGARVVSEEKPNARRLEKIIIDMT